ncbi:MAG: hypothetical protein IJ644_00180 [Oscillospiraceae bacterium]|nr:hypothetical protein [Oscillospiraceae bacterium]
MKILDANMVIRLFVHDNPESAFEIFILQDKIKKRKKFRPAVTCRTDSFYQK